MAHSRIKRSSIPLIMIFAVFAIMLVIFAIPIFSSYDNNENIQKTAAYEGSSAIALQFTELSPIFVIFVSLISLCIVFIILRQSYNLR